MRRKYGRVFRAAMALALVAWLVPIMAAPAQACMAIQIFPTNGRVGTVICITYQNAYGHAGEWGNPAITKNTTTFESLTPSLTPRLTLTHLSNDTAMFPEGYFFVVVPDVPPGKYELTAYDLSAVMVPNAKATFTVMEGPVRRA